MSDHAHGDKQDSHDVTELPDTGDVDGADAVESYETEDGIVFYDAENPLAWLKANRALTLSEQV